MKPTLSENTLKVRIRKPLLPTSQKLKTAGGSDMGKVHNKFNCRTVSSNGGTKKHLRPVLSAGSWIILHSNGSIIDSHNANEVREIASLTKIMTCIITIEEVYRTRRSFQEYIHISESACNIQGTKAGLLPSDSMKLWDLLHGLMLPSGNDAALALAEIIGKNIDSSGSPISNFITKMNLMSKFLNLDLTSFSNTHGMSTSLNLSTANNVAKLAAYGLRIPMFQRIVNTLNYQCNIYNKGEIRKAVWVNTNKLLWKGFSGVKTGFTPNAGPCLCCSIDGERKNIIVVLLGVKTMKARWAEAVRLWKWATRETLD